MGFFFVYGVFFSPDQDKEILPKLIKGCFTFDFGRVDFSIVAVFMAMGFVPCLLALYLFPERGVYNPSVWPFILGSFVIGAGAILPYLAVRKIKVPETLIKSQVSVGSLEMFMMSKVVRLSAVVILFLGVFAGFYFGDWKAYLQAFKTSRVVNVMSFDFLILVFVVLPYLVKTQKLK
jgi:hypothetical protein